MDDLEKAQLDSILENSKKTLFTIFNEMNDRVNRLLELHRWDTGITNDELSKNIIQAIFQPKDV